MANSSSDRAVIDLVINGQQAQTSLKQVSLEVTRATAAIVKMKETDAGYNDKLKELHALLAAQRQMRAQINDTTTAWSRFKSNIASTAVGVLGGNIMGTALSAVTSAIPAAIGKIREFDAASQELSAVTGATGRDLEFLNKTAARTGPEFGKSGAEMLEAYKLMASAKPELLDQKELLVETTKAAITLSQAGTIPLAEATQVTAESLNQFGESADQANRFINVIAAGAKEGSAEIADMGVALKNSGTVAKAQGVSFEQTNAILQSMSTIALKGGEAGTGLRNVLLTLGSGSDETNPRVVGLQKALDNLAKQNLSTAEMTKLFGKENITAAQHIITHRGEIAELTKKITGTQEAFTQAEKNNKSLDHQLEVFYARVSGLGVLLGTYLVPAFTKVVDVATDLTKLLTGQLTPASEVANQAFEDQRQKVNNLTSNINPLLNRYDELKKKSVLTKDEQDELNKIIGQVAKTIPSAVSQFDAYGRAMDINTDKARKAIDVQQALLEHYNKTAIAETTSERDRKIQQLNAAIAKRKAGMTVDEDLSAAGGGYRKMTEEELQAAQDEIDQLNAEIDQQNALLTGLTGYDKAARRRRRRGEPEPPVKPPATTPPPPGGNGGGSGNGPTDEQKKAQKKQQDEAKQRAEQLERMLSESRAGALKAEQSDYDKAVTAFADKYTKMYVLASGNAQKIAEIDQLAAVEMLSIQQEFGKKKAEEAQKQGLEELKDIKELAEKELKLKQQLALLDVDTAVSTKGSGVTKEKAKEMELAIEMQFLTAKEVLYTEHYEAMMNMAFGNQEAMKAATQEYNAAMAAIGQARLETEGQQAIASTETRTALSEQIKKTAKEEVEFQHLMAQQIYSVLSTNWDQTLESYKTYWKESNTVQKAALLAMKAYAIAEIAINLQRQISADLTAAAKLNAIAPGSGFFYGASTIAIHTVQAAARTAAVLGVQGFEEGGFTGEARVVYPGQMGPSGWINSPTLFNLGRRSYVAGEAGREFVISNQALQNPVVADFARIMDVAQKTGNYSMLSASALPNGSQSAAGSSGMSAELGMAMLQQLQQNNALLAQYAERPIQFDLFALERKQQEIDYVRNATKG